MKKKIIIIILIFGIILVGCELFRNKRNNSEITISQDSSDLIEKTEEIVEENNNLIETKEEKKEDIDIKMTAIGDIMCHNTQYNDAYLADSKTYDFSYVFTDIEKYINSADIAVGNLETTFAGKERGYSSYPRFNTPEQLATNLKKLGIDVVSTANNHCMDTNYSGLVSTLKYLDEAEIAHTGTNESEESQNKILIQDVKGIKIAFLSFTYGTNGISIPSDKKYAVNLIDDELIIKQLQLAKEQKPDLICVSMHWGEEYQTKPNSEQKRLANLLFENGVDIIPPTCIAAYGEKRDNIRRWNDKRMFCNIFIRKLYVGTSERRNERFYNTEFRYKEKWRNWKNYNKQSRLYTNIYVQIYNRQYKKIQNFRFREKRF